MKFHSRFLDWVSRRAAGQGRDRMNLSSPCPAAAYVTCPGFGKYEPGAYPFVGLARMFHGIGAMKKAMRLATAPSSGYLRMYV